MTIATLPHYTQAQKHVDSASGLSRVLHGAGRAALFKPAQRDIYQRLRLINQATPIGFLPPEILGQIFDVAIRSKPPEDNFPWSHPWRRRSLPVTLSQVSGYWREVALNSPLLWSDVDISPPWALNIIRLYLTRSKSCPIHLNLGIPTIAFGNLLTPAVANASAHILCDIIAPHISRCRKITVKGDFHHLEPLLEAVMKIFHPLRAPRLEHLVMQVTSVRQTYSSFFSEGAPILSHLRLSCIMMPYLPQLPKLTSLHLALGDGHGIDLITLHSIATSCTSLETLALIDDVVCGPWPLTATIDFPSLRSLQIYGTFTGVSDLLRVVSAPLLEDLVIAPVVADDLLAYHQGAATSAPKFPNLRSITLEPVSASGFSLLLVAAECFPDVERLTIPKIYPDSFHDVFTGVDVDVFWPNLKALAVRNIDTSAMEKLLDVISFRAAAGRPLRTIYLDSASVCRNSSTVLPLALEVVEHDMWMQLILEMTHLVENEFDYLF
ncbi:hypothetical protein DXG03_006902 [Asterophora parasitica]|uniref:F-box domain-containing protein n=1 Tax=Asterophora parasitica TaxID=117018 RepID=A0A9P7KBZ8_9AGAR|nr:hypothetical protein DXG03_006902 [Asterophora parasitica]